MVDSSVLSEVNRIRKLIGFNESVNNILTEITSKEAKTRYYQKLDDELYYKIVQLDPTYNRETDQFGKYDKWLLQSNNVTIIQKTKPEDLYKITEDLRIYDKLKNSNKLPDEYKDISRLSVQELASYIFNNYTSQTNFDINSITSKTQDIENIKSNADKYDVGDFTIINPKTEEAACLYGKGTRWCTAAEYNNMFDHYNRTGKLWILIDKGNPSHKYQFHFEDKQFMNAQDDPIDAVEFFAENNEVYKFFEQIYPNINYILTKFAAENIGILGNEESFHYFYSNDFSDDEKYNIVSILMDKISEGSDGYADFALRMLYEIKYDFKSLKNSDSNIMSENEWDYERALEGIISYDLYSYDREYLETPDFIHLFGGLNYGDVETLYNKLHNNEMKLFMDIIQKFNNGGQLLNEFIVDNDLSEEFQTKNEVLLTIIKLQKMFPKYPILENKLVKITVNSVDYENETLNITLEKKDDNGDSKQKMSGNIDYKNIFSYLNNYSLFEEFNLNWLAII